MTLPAPFIVPAEEAGHTLAAVLRARMPGQSWSQVRALVTARKVQVLGDLCLDPARRLKMYEEIQQSVMDDAFILGTFEQTLVNAQAKTVQDLSYDNLGRMFFQKVWLKK